MKVTELLALLVLVLALVLGVAKPVGKQTNHLLQITIAQQTGGKIDTK